MADDVFAQLTNHIHNTLSLILAIEERQKHPDRSVYNEDRAPQDITADDRARIRYFDAIDRSRLAAVAAKIGTLADWGQVTDEWAATAEEHRTTARDLYDKRMSEPPPAVVDVDLPLFPLEAS